MRFIECPRAVRAAGSGVPLPAVGARVACISALWLVSACTAPPVLSPPDAAPETAEEVGSPAPAAVPAPSGAASPAPRVLRLPPPQRPESLQALQVLAAQRMVAAHPDSSYAGTPPEPLLAIPVLEVELHADGSIRNIQVLREPRAAKDTIQLAVNIVRAAAPYGDVSRLKRPWKFVQVFLFDDERRFKPAVLDR